ncbi:carboxypeptidase regulatory-like domain-containing protein, partial [bacterium]|nr:carboxypeptidase regulatory-like domain-containing protein [bacterium]
RHAVGGDELTFQVVLHDGNVYPTASGDDKILFQYRSIDNTENLRNGDDEWLEGIPYASVGISSPDGKTGINYTWGNEYPISAAQIEPRRALLFITSMFESWDGFLSGTVTDASNNEPLENVTVISRFVQIATTDANGYWEIPDAITDFEFDLRFTLEGYNDSVVSELFLEDDEELTIDVALLHPEFEPSQWSFVRHQDPEITVDMDFTIENTGNGPLDWALRRLLPGNADVDPWEFRMSYAVSDSVADARVEGVVFADDRFFVSGSNISDGDDGDNMIYVLDRDGQEVNRFAQFGESTYGMKDLAWDGELIWGCDGNTVIGFTTDGDSVTSFEGPDGSLNAIAWDPDREVLWVARKTGNAIYAVTREGEEVMSVPRYSFRIYGLAYWKDAPDDSKLYIYHCPNNETDVVHKVNPENGDTTFVRILEHDEGGSPRGAFCTNQYDIYSWVFICVADNNADDRIDIWQLEARRDWFKVFTELDPDIPAEHGRIEARETKDFTLRLSSNDLPPDVEFNGCLIFRHDTTGRPSDTLNVLLDVVGERRPTDFSLLYPANRDTLPENPSYDTTMVTFAWEQSFDYNADDHVAYTAFFSAGDDTVSIECGDATSLNIEALELASDFNLPIETEWQLDWWVLSISSDDTVRCREDFTVRFVPDVINNSGDNMPVEFGLQSIYPSPFNAVTRIRFGIDIKEHVQLCVYDLAGRQVAVLLDGNPAIGYHSIAWNASSFPSGLYFIRLESVERIEIAKVALIR